MLLNYQLQSTNSSSPITPSSASTSSTTNAVSPTQNSNGLVSNGDADKGNLLIRTLVGSELMKQFTNSPNVITPTSIYKSNYNAFPPRESKTSADSVDTQSQPIVSTASKKPTTGTRADAEILEQASLLKKRESVNSKPRLTRNTNKKVTREASDQEKADKSIFHFLFHSYFQETLKKINSNEEKAPFPTVMARRSVPSNMKKAQAMEIDEGWNVNDFIEVDGHKTNEISSKKGENTEEQSTKLEREKEKQEKQRDLEKQKEVEKDREQEKLKESEEKQSREKQDKESKELDKQKDTEKQKKENQKLLKNTKAPTTSSLLNDGEKDTGSRYDKETEKQHEKKMKKENNEQTKSLKNQNEKKSYEKQKDAEKSPKEKQENKEKREKEKESPSKGEKEKSDDGQKGDSDSSDPDKEKSDEINEDRSDGDQSEQSNQDDSPHSESGEQRDKKDDSQKLKGKPNVLAKLISTCLLLICDVFKMQKLWKSYIR